MSQKINWIVFCMTRALILKAWCYCKTLAGILALLWLETFPFQLRNSGFWTSNQLHEDYSCRNSSGFTPDSLFICFWADTSVLQLYIFPDSGIISHFVELSIHSDGGLPKIWCEIFYFKRFKTCGCFKTFLSMIKAPCSSFCPLYSNT